jgi:hypothetical protein
MQQEPDEITDTTVDWQSEPPRIGFDLFRERPSAFFAWLGAILFVSGWGVAIYSAFLAGESMGPITSSPGPSVAYRLQYLLSIGTSVTLAAAVLWGVAAYLWVQTAPVADADLG